MGKSEESRSGSPPRRNRTISELPDDVILDILVRMPDLKSIIRCKRVCKKWRGLILQPYFVKSHCSRGYSLPQSLIFYGPSDSLTNPAQFRILELDHNDLARLPFKKGKKIPARLVCQGATVTFRSEIYIPRGGYKGRVIGACNGLVCLHVDEDFVVCNPILQGRRPFVLPKLPKLAHSCRSRFGFGYSRLSDEYKVLRCNGTVENHIISIDVCTIGRDDTWRSIGVHNGKPFPRHYYTEECINYTFPRADFVYANGALYWRGLHMASRFLCYFDVENEELGNLSLPCYNDGMLRLGVLDNFLYLCDVRWSSCVKVWVMTDYRRTGDLRDWTLEWVVKPPYPLGLEGPVRPIKVLKDKTVLMILNDKVLVSHNPQTGLLEMIKCHEVLCWNESIAHSPSFLCPPWLL